MATPSSVTISTPDGPMPADWVRPTTGAAPTLILCQEIFGVTDYVRRRARDLAAQGYGVLTPHFYWRLGTPGTNSSGSADSDESADSVAPVIAETGAGALERAMALSGRLDFDAAVADGATAYAFARESADRVGLIGFCYGGALAFAVAARTDPDVLVSYYGSGLPGLLDLAPDIRCPSLHHFGDADSFIDAEARGRIREAVTSNGAVWRSHPGADHAFDNDDAGWYHPQASASAWATTLEFLHDRLRPHEPSTAGEHR